MTNKQALREEFQYMQEHYSDPADRARQVIYIAAIIECDHATALEMNEKYDSQRDDLRKK